MKNKKFVASLSGGKDSSQAVLRAIQMGYEPLFFFTTFNKENQRNFFHGMDVETIQKISSITGVPLHKVETDNDSYCFDFDVILKKAKDEGADLCVFGDIDIESHREWGKKMCEKSGLETLYPLWQIPRKKVINDFIDEGFEAVVNIVDTTKVPESFLGRIFDRKLIEDFEKIGVDPCGESGEFHTFVFNAPYFSEKIEYTLSDVQLKNNHAYKILRLK